MRRPVGVKQKHSWPSHGSSLFSLPHHRRILLVSWMINRSGLLLALGLFSLCGAPVLEATGTTIVPAKIPDDFPKDFPIYKDATVKSYGPIVPLSPSLGNILVLQTFDSKATVLEFYRKELPAQGWTIEKPVKDCPDSLTAQKEGRRVSVSVLEREGPKPTTLIQLGVNGTP